MDMKLRGMYIARQLSFHGVTFKIEEVPLSESFRKAYDESVELVSFESEFFIRLRCFFIRLPRFFWLSEYPNQKKFQSSNH